MRRWLETLPVEEPLVRLVVRPMSESFSLFGSSRKIILRTGRALLADTTRKVKKRCRLPSPVEMSDVGAGSLRAVLQTRRGNADCSPSPKYQVVASGKAKKVALVACMRQLLTIVNALLKHRTRWNPELVQHA
jgi:hypothetical protein